MIWESLLGKQIRAGNFQANRQFVDLYLQLRTIQVTYLLGIFLKIPTEQQR